MSGDDSFDGGLPVGKTETTGPRGRGQFYVSKASFDKPATQWFAAGEACTDQRGQRNPFGNIIDDRFLVGVNMSSTVYVVDDDSATREALDSILRSVGYDVELFATGTEFLGRARRDMRGCIVLDVRLPGPSGLEVQRRLSEAGIRTPIVFVTGHGDIAMAVQAMKANAVEFLTKPFRDHDLLDAISEAMERDGFHSKRSEEREESLRLLQKLSAREYEIFLQLCGGRLGKQISHDLGVSEATVKVHRRNIMQKLEVSSISQLIVMFGHLAHTDEAVS